MNVNSPSSTSRFAHRQLPLRCRSQSSDCVETKAKSNEMRYQSSMMSTFGDYSIKPFEMRAPCAVILCALDFICSVSWWQIEFKLKWLFIGEKARKITVSMELCGIKKGLFMLLRLLACSPHWVIYEFLKYFLLCFIYSFQIAWSNLMAINIGIGYNLIRRKKREAKWKWKERSLLWQKWCGVKLLLGCFLSSRKSFE